MEVEIPDELDHNCAENIKLDNEFDQVGCEVIFSGECSVCGKKVTQTFTYLYTREQESGEAIDDVLLLEKCEKPFIGVSVWRGMNVYTIIGSIMGGLEVLRDTGFGEDDHQKEQLRVLIEKIANMLRVEEKT